MGASADDSQGAIVVPADHGGSSLACIRSLGRQGIDVVGVASSDAAPPLQSKYCTEARVVPAPGTDLAGYRDALLDLAARDDVLSIAPLFEPDAYVLGENRETFADRIATPWPDFDGIRAAQDRRRLFELADGADVPAPETALFSEWDRWDEATIVKPRYTMVREDGGVRYPEVSVYGPGEAPDLDAVRAEMGHEPIVQEYVPGDAECGFFAVCDDGEPVARFQHRRVRSYTYAGGASVYREAIDDPDLDDAGSRLLATLDWEGPAMVEFKRDERTGDLRLVEVNPRFWGSLPLAVHAGVDFPYAFYRLAAGDPPLADTGYETGVGCHTIRGEASYLHSVARYDYDHLDSPSLARSLLDVCASLYRQPNFDYLSLDDGKPFVQDVLTRTPGPTLPPPG